jgi:hypothetical protein
MPLRSALIRQLIVLAICCAWSARADAESSDATPAPLDPRGDFVVYKVNNWFGTSDPSDNPYSHSYVVVYNRRTGGVERAYSYVDLIDPRTKRTGSWEKVDKPQNIEGGRKAVEAFLNGGHWTALELGRGTKVVLMLEREYARRAFAPDQYNLVWNNCKHEANELFATALNNARHLEMSFEQENYQARQFHPPAGAEHLKLPMVHAKTEMVGERLIPEGFPKSKTPTAYFGEKIPDLRKYYEPPQALQLSSPHEHRVIYDRIVQHPDPSKIVDAMNDTIGFLHPMAAALSRAGRVPEIKTADSLGSIDQAKLDNAGRLPGGYENATRLKVLDDGTFALMRMDRAAQTWRAMPKADAIEFVHSRLAYKYRLDAPRDTSDETLFKAVSGHQWQPVFDGFRGAEISTIAALPENTPVTVKYSNERYEMTAGSFLEGNLPKLQTALETEKYQSQQFRTARDVPVTPPPQVKFGRVPLPEARVRVDKPPDQTLPFFPPRRPPPPPPAAIDPIPSQNGGGGGWSRSPGNQPISFSNGRSWDAMPIARFWHSPPPAPRLGGIMLAPELEVVIDQSGVTSQASTKAVEAVAGKTAGTFVIDGKEYLAVKAPGSSKLLKVNAGRLHLRQTDLRIEIADGAGIDLERFYDSAGDGGSPLGKGWTFSPITLRLQRPIPSGERAFARQVQLIDHTRGDEYSYQLDKRDGDGQVPMTDAPPTYSTHNAQLAPRLAGRSDGGYVVTTSAGSFNFDAAARLCSAATAAGEVFYRYENHRLAELASAGKKITFQYEDGCLTGASASGGESVTYQMKDNRLARVSTALEHLSFVYDASGCLARVESGEGATFKLMLRATFDEQRRLLSKESPQGCWTFAYDDAVGKMTTISPIGETTICFYGAAGELIAYGLAPQAMTILNHDAQGRVLQVGAAELLNDGSRTEPPRFKINEVLSAP